MHHDTRNDYVARDSILKLLSDQEVARVSTAETKHLFDGEEYIDLEQLAEGVHRARGPNVSMGRLLPRKAVNEATWSKILEQLPALSKAIV